MKEVLINIVKQFKDVGAVLSIAPITSGHINETFLVTADRNYVLQKLNREVFKDLPALMVNKVAISKHLQSKLAHHSRQTPVLTFLSADEETFYVEEVNDFWCLTYYIENAVTYEKVSSINIAKEAGKVTGQFLFDCGDFDATQLKKILPEFHVISKRLYQLDQAIMTADNLRLKKAEETLNKIDQERNSVCFIENAIKANDIPLRVTHNDTKVSNILFDKNEKGLCMIDTDTVMPGAVAYDYGDAIRSICNAADEDESNLSLVDFNLDYFQAYTTSFMSEINSLLSEKEIECMAHGIRLMPYIMAVRFMTDYLNGDVYFKTKYPEHNLDRAKNQIKLLERIDENFEEINKTITNMSTH